MGCKTARTDGDAKFITVAHDNQERFVNGENVLIKKVHEDHWDIFYNFEPACPASRKSEKNYQAIRDVLEKSIKRWLNPLREITDRPIVDKFVFHRVPLFSVHHFFNQEESDKINPHIRAVFYCSVGKSTACRGCRKISIQESPTIAYNTPVSPDLLYSIKSILHELGHAFDLADTYTGNPGFDPPNIGVESSTIGSHAKSIMSSRNCFSDESDLPLDGSSLGSDICTDDKIAIQWLYRYHWEGLDPTSCPPKFVYEELTDKGRTVGGCVPQQPLLFEAQQGHLAKVRFSLVRHKNLKIINDQDEHGYAVLHYVAVYSNKLHPKVQVKNMIGLINYPDIDLNIRNKHGNRPLHLAATYNNHIVCEHLVADPRVKVNIRNTMKYTPLHYAARLGRNECAKFLLTHKSIEVNVQDFVVANTPLHEAAKNGHTEVVKMLLAHKDINRNIRNRAGKTARQLAVDKGYQETVKAFD